MTDTKKPSFNPEDASVQQPTPSSQADPAQAARHSYDDQLRRQNEGINRLLELRNNAGRVTAVGNTSSKTPAEVAEKIREIHNSLPADALDFTPEVITCEGHPLKIPAVVIYAEVGGNIIHFTMMLEALGAPLAPFYDESFQPKIEIDMPTARYYDDLMEDRVKKSVVSDLRRRKSASAGTLIDAGHLVIPRTIDLHEGSGLSAYYDSSISAILAYINLGVRGVSGILKASMLVASDLNLYATNQITPGQTIVTAHGKVVAQDFQTVVSVRGDNTKRREASLHDSATEFFISKASGFIDFAYAEPEQSTLQQAAMTGQLVPAYHPYIVMTNVSPLGAGSVTQDDLLTQLLAVASMAGIASNNSWVEVFTRSGVDSGKKTNLGVLGLEYSPVVTQPGKKPPKLEEVVVVPQFDPTGNTITPANFVAKYCHPTMVIAMDIEQGGELSWMQKLLAQATPGSAEAALIIRELDEFSDGIFSASCWDPRDAICGMPSTEIHLGTYVDSKGEVRDIRSLDYLAAVSASKGNLQTMKDYSEGAHPGNTLQAVDRRRHLLKDWVGFTQTGMATRIWFSAKFMNALDRMLELCKLRFTLEGLSTLNAVDGRTSAFDSQFVGAVNSGAFRAYSGPMQQGQAMQNFTQGGMAYFNQR